MVNVQNENIFMNCKNKLILIQNSSNAENDSLTMAASSSHLMFSYVVATDPTLV